MIERVQKTTQRITDEKTLTLPCNPAEKITARVPIHLMWNLALAHSACSLCYFAAIWHGLDGSLVILRSAIHAVNAVLIVVSVIGICRDTYL